MERQAEPRAIQILNVKRRVLLENFWKSDDLYFSRRFPDKMRETLSVSYIHAILNHLAIIPVLLLNTFSLILPGVSNHPNVVSHTGMKGIEMNTISLPPSQKAMNDRQKKSFMPSLSQIKVGDEIAIRIYPIHVRDPAQKTYINGVVVHKCREEGYFFFRFATNDEATIHLKKEEWVFVGSAASTPHQRINTKVHDLQRNRSERHFQC